MKKYIQLKDTWRTKAGEEWIQLNEDTTLYLHYGTQTLEKEEVIKAHPEWFKEVKESKPSLKKWRAEYGGKYWVNASGDICSNTERFDKYDNYSYLTGNYFQTDEEAEAYKARQEAIGRVTHAIIEANEGQTGNNAIVYRNGKYNTLLVDYKRNNSVVPLCIPPVLNEATALSIISSHKEDLDLIFNVKK